MRESGIERNGAGKCERVADLKAEEGMVAKTRESVAGILAVTSEVEEKFKTLAQERTLIQEAQGQIQSLRLMVEDLKSGIRNATEEEQKITVAVSKASELEFLIGEADSAIANLRRLKPKA